MPDLSSLRAWRAQCPDPARNPLDGMAAAGLLAPADSYLQIARIKAALVEQTGLLGVGGVWGGRQVAGRHFLAGFGTPRQLEAWLGRAVAVAISEPGVGAHPKHLTTRAEPDGDGFRISGEKAWVSNGPGAEVFVVVAITGVEDGRKRYSAFLVPRHAEGLVLKDMPRFHALRPSQHCGLLLQQVVVPRDSLLGPEGQAYEAMALPFRDVEDAVGTFGLLGALRFLLQALPRGTAPDETALAAGSFAALTAVFAAGAEAVVAALDAQRLQQQAATLAGLHLLAADMVGRMQARFATQAQHDPAVQEVLRDIDVTLSVARGPRQARLMRLGMPGPADRPQP